MIHRHGYIIKKNSISDDELKSIKDELYITPIVPKSSVRILNPIRYIMKMKIQLQYQDIMESNILEMQNINLNLKK